MQQMDNVKLEELGALRVGDVVRLNSGGPLMVVLAGPEDAYVSCAWHGTGGAPYCSDYPVACLRTVARDAS